MTRKATVQNSASAALALLTLFPAMVPTAIAKPRPSEQPATVIAHLLLPGAPASQMFVQEHGGKHTSISSRPPRKV